MHESGHTGLMLTTAILATLVSTILMAETARGAAVWTVKSLASRCTLESSPESVNDGYQTTTARIRVDDKTVAVTSSSVFDAGFSDIGIAVDEHEFIPMDRLGDSRTAVFESQYPALVDQFKRGLRARVQLRFWPTWPVTGTHSATFSLIGFTRAHAHLAECQ